MTFKKGPSFWTRHHKGSARDIGGITVPVHGLQENYAVTVLDAAGTDTGIKYKVSRKPAGDRAYVRLKPGGGFRWFDSTAEAEAYILANA